MTTIQSIAIFLVGLFFGIAVLILIGTLLNLSPDLPVAITAIIHWIVSSSYYLDFLVPIKLMWTLFLIVLTFEGSLLVLDGVILAWKNLKRFHS